jgi:hypothetical protein
MTISFRNCPKKGKGKGKCKDKGKGKGKGKCKCKCKGKVLCKGKSRLGGVVAAEVRWGRVVARAVVTDEMIG